MWRNTGRKLAVQAWYGMLIARSATSVPLAARGSVRFVVCARNWRQVPAGTCHGAAPVLSGTDPRAAVRPNVSMWVTGEIWPPTTLLRVENGGECREFIGVLPPCGVCR